MDPKSGTLLAPTIRNASCSHPRYTHTMLIASVGPFDAVQALLILALSLGIIGANLLVIFVINHRRYTPYIQQQPRYLLTSLALNDFAIGVFITPFGVLPALFHCWPFGEIYCQIQALLRGALSQQSAVILVCMAIDRYICAMYPHKYDQHASKKGCVAILSITWTLCLTLFGMLVLPKGYYFNSTGLLVCEPFYSKASYRILATCSLYFPTTMILMYCYGSSFHASSMRMVTAGTTTSAAAANCGGHHHHALPMTTTLAAISSNNSSSASGSDAGGGYAATTAASPVMTTAATALGGKATSTTMTNTTTTMSTTTMTTAAISTTNEKIPFQPIGPERRARGSASRTMAAMSLGFIVMATPWTIQEVVAACTGSKVPPFLDFLVTWTAISNSFWNPFLYWLLNAHFRRISRELLTQSSCCSSSHTVATDEPAKSHCCSISSDCQNDSTALPLPPGPPSSRPPLGDLECLSEKYWGDILERTVSSTSLHALQRIYGQSPTLPPPSHAQRSGQHQQQHAYNQQQHGTPRSQSATVMRGNHQHHLHHHHQHNNTLPATILKHSAGTPRREVAAAHINGGLTPHSTMATMADQGDSGDGSAGQDDDDDDDDDDDADDTGDADDDDVATVRNGDSGGGSLMMASPAETVQCERHFQHDAHCAKSKAYFGVETRHVVMQSLSDV